MGAATPRQLLSGQEGPIGEGRALGTDVCSKGWVGVALGAGAAEVHFGRTIRELLTIAQAGAEVDVLAIDIPIGLPDNSHRQADELARQVAGPRRQSVFMTPVRAALLADDHASAVVVNQRLVGKGVSRQAYGLRTKIFEVDAWIQDRSHIVIEAHPEVCFATMARGPLATRKKTWA